MEAEKMKIKRWVTKNCLEKGIRHCVGNMEKYPGWFYAQGVGSLRKSEHHETYEQAKEKAESMRIKRIAALKKKIKELEEMEF